MTAIIELPYPPSINHYYRHVGYKTLISKDGRAYRRAVAATCLPLFKRPTKDLISVTITLNPPDRRRRDIDNTLKPLLDAMQHGKVYVDDSQIKELHVTMGDVLQGGRATVQIETIKQGDDE